MMPRPRRPLSVRPKPNGNIGVADVGLGMCANKFVCVYNNKRAQSKTLIDRAISSSLIRYNINMYA